MLLNASHKLERSDRLSLIFTENNVHTSANNPIWSQPHGPRSAVAKLLKCITPYPYVHTYGRMLTRVVGE